MIQSQPISGDSIFSKRKLPHHTLKFSEPRGIKLRLNHYRKINPTTDCWEWTGGVLSKERPYGAIRIEGTTRLVHRVSAFCYLGFDIESELEILHSCDNHRCFNPAHLTPGSQADNMQDMIRKGRAVILRGERNPAAKLTELDIQDIRIRHREGQGYKTIGKAYGVQDSLIYAIIKRKIWRHLPDPPQAA